MDSVSFYGCGEGDAAARVGPRLISLLVPVTTAHTVACLADVSEGY